MVEMAYGLQYKHDDHTTAIQFINAQLEMINSQAVFAREQDRLEMIRILHAARVEADNGKDLDMEILLNLIGVFLNPKMRRPVMKSHYRRLYLLRAGSQLMRQGIGSA